MQNIFAKIDDEINEREHKAFLTAMNLEVEKGKAQNLGEIKGLELAKQIIAAEYKNPCENCIGPSLAISRGIKDMRVNPERKPLTIGDKIRESNESLAEAIKKAGCGCECRYCTCEHSDKECLGSRCVEGILAHLNQPYTE